MLIQLLFWALILVFSFLIFVRWFVLSGAIYRVDQWIHDFDRAINDLQRDGYKKVNSGIFVHWKLYKAARLRMKEYQKFR